MFPTQVSQAEYIRWVCILMEKYFVNLNISCLVISVISFQEKKSCPCIAHRTFPSLLFLQYSVPTSVQSLGKEQHTPPRNNYQGAREQDKQFNTEAADPRTETPLFRFSITNVICHYADHTAPPAKTNCPSKHRLWSSWDPRHTPGEQPAPQQLPMLCSKKRSPRGKSSLCHTVAPWTIHTVFYGTQDLGCGSACSSCAQGSHSRAPWQAARQHDRFSDSSLPGAGSLDCSDSQRPRKPSPAPIAHTRPSPPQPDTKRWARKHTTTRLRNSRKRTHQLQLSFSLKFDSKSIHSSLPLRLFWLSSFLIKTLILYIF